VVSEDPDNILYHGQTLKDVAVDAAVACALQPGQASFHHGWTVHASMPNRADERRIGLNVQYIAPHVRQLKTPHFTALLARGHDAWGHYDREVVAQSDLAPDTMARREILQARYMEAGGAV